MLNCAPPRRLQGGLRLRAQTESPARPRALRIHLKNPDISTRSIRPEPERPDDSTQQPACCLAGGQRLMTTAMALNSNGDSLPRTIQQRRNRLRCTASGASASGRQPRPGVAGRERSPGPKADAVGRTPSASGSRSALPIAPDKSVSGVRSAIMACRNFTPIAGSGSVSDTTGAPAES